MTIKEVVRGITDALHSYSDAPHLDAQWIVLHVLGQRDTSYLISHSTQPLLPSEVEAVQSMAEERKTGKPLGYILGETDFYGRTFIVTTDVLVPHADTEDLVEKTLGYVQDKYSNAERITIAEIGTGSGCVIITLALELRSQLPHLNVTYIATDISEEALNIAKLNAEKHGMLNHIEFLQGDMLTPLQHRHIDLIVSNPPYLPTEEVDNPSQNIETRGIPFEPRISLDGGVDGLTFVRQLHASGTSEFIQTLGVDIIEPNI
jgi:release factor glutamine methyltransferase